MRRFHERANRSPLVVGESTISHKPESEFSDKILDQTKVFRFAIESLLGEASSRQLGGI